MLSNLTYRVVLSAFAICFVLGADHTVAAKNQGTAGASSRVPVRALAKRSGRVPRSAEATRSVTPNTPVALDKPIFIIELGPSIRNILRPFGGKGNPWLKELATTMGVEPRSLKTVRVHQGGKLPDPREASGFIIPGSRAMITTPNDATQKALRWLPKVFGQKTPVVGLCYGHQVIATALGGKVGWNTDERELRVGSRFFTLNNEGRQHTLFDGISAESIAVQVAHAQRVITMPTSGVELLGSIDGDPHAAIAMTEAPVTGVQFHPDYDPGIIGAIVRYVQHHQQKRRPDKIISCLPLNTTAIRSTEQSATVLQNFLQLVRRSASGT